MSYKTLSEESESKQYPSKPVFTGKVDEQKRIYLTAYSNITSNAVVSLDDENVIVEGNPKINLRLGSSEHGEELIFELLRTGEVTKASKNSKHDTIEIYLPMAAGLSFLKEAITFFEQKQKQLEEIQKWKQTKN